MKRRKGDVRPCSWLSQGCQRLQIRWGREGGQAFVKTISERQRLPSKAAQITVQKESALAHIEQVWFAIIALTRCIYSNVWS